MAMAMAANAEIAASRNSRTCLLPIYPTVARRGNVASASASEMMAILEKPMTKKQVRHRIICYRPGFGANIRDIGSADGSPSVA